MPDFPHLPLPQNVERKNYTGQAIQYQQDPLHPCRFSRITVFDPCDQCGRVEAAGHLRS